MGSLGQLETVLLILLPNWIGLFGFVVLLGSGFNFIILLDPSFHLLRLGSDSMR